jgi:hypothetical protein
MSFGMGSSPSPQISLLYHISLLGVWEAFSTRFFKKEFFSPPVRPTPPVYKAAARAYNG